VSVLSELCIPISRPATSEFTDIVTRLFLLICFGCCCCGGGNDR
jgi:hypothetical protein